MLVRVGRGRDAVKLTPAQARRRERKIARRRDARSVRAFAAHVDSLTGDVVGPLITVPIPREQLDDAAATGWLGGER